VNLNATESLVSVAPSAGDGATNVIAGLGAAEADAETRPTATAAATASSSGLQAVCLIASS